MPAAADQGIAPHRPVSAQKHIIVRTVGLKRSYLKGAVLTEALRGVDVAIERGEFVCVMGPSGSGKSTFFNMIGGLDTPTAGRVFIDEVDVAQLNAYELAFLRCRKIGYIFQQFNLVKYMTALENVTAAMAFAGASSDEARERGMELLHLVNLADRWFHKPIEMSGGQQQRVAIARAMANRPSILLADEPTGNLDLKTGTEVLQIMQRLNTEQGVTIICVSHDHKMLAAADRVLWIRDGRVARDERTETLDIRVGRIDGAAE